MQTLQNFPGLGESMSGLEGTTEKNLKFLGGVRAFDRVNMDAKGPRRLIDGTWIFARLMANRSGGALNRGVLARLNDSGTSGDSVAMYTEVEGYGATLHLRTVVLIDPWYPTATVPDDGLFWGIFKGIAPCLSHASGSAQAAITVGGHVVCSAGAGGRITGPPGTLTAESVAGILGTAVEACGATTYDTATLVNWNIPAIG